LQAPFIVSAAFPLRLFLFSSEGTYATAGGVCAPLS
jgi:hypothetical protein